jgi:hypothetical protein
MDSEIGLLSSILQFRRLLLRRLQYSESIVNANFMSVIKE